MMGPGLHLGAALLALAASGPTPVATICSVMNGERICTQSGAAPQGGPNPAPPATVRAEGAAGPAPTAAAPALSADASDRSRASAARPAARAARPSRRPEAASRKRAHRTDRRRRDERDASPAYERVYGYERRWSDRPLRRRPADESEDLCERRRDLCAD